MIRLLVFLLLFFLGYTLYQALARALFPPRPPRAPGASREGEEMVRDPQCGTYLPRTDALSKTVGGEKHYFCSEKCRDAYTGKK